VTKIGRAELKSNPCEANKRHLKPGLWASGLKWAGTSVIMTFTGPGEGSGLVAPSASESPKNEGNSRFKRGPPAVAGYFSLLGRISAQK
jgi:hypothetical protein